MLRISVAALAIFASTLCGFSQTTGDSTAYKKRKLRLDEVNFVSGYYKQDGNNSAVTGGIGSEHLTDFATTLDVTMSKYDRRGRKHTITGELGIDVYTSASSDKIDPTTISSASSGDNRVYPSIAYSIANEGTGRTLSFIGSISTEYDYFSKGIGIGITQLSKDRSREFSAKAQGYFDTWTVILPIELRGSSGLDGTMPRNSYSASFTFSQVINRRLQVLILADIAYQTGQLATLYQRTYFNDGTHEVENLPDTRLKIPLGVRLNYFAGDRVVFRTYYRYYADDWGLRAHTAELETVMKITPFFSVSPFYRFSQQQGIKYFAGYGMHGSGETFYTSDYDLSSLHSNMFGMGLRISPPGGIFGISRFAAMELRYGHYERSTGLVSDIATVSFKFK